MVDVLAIVRLNQPELGLDAAGLVARGLVGIVATRVVFSSSL